MVLLHNTWDPDAINYVAKENSCDMAFTYSMHTMPL